MQTSEKNEKCIGFHGFRIEDKAKNSFGWLFFKNIIIIY